MRANRYTLAKLCLLAALAVPAQRAASATVSHRTPQAGAIQLLAQSNAGTEFTLPASLDDAETLLIDGSSSMRTMNSALTAQFQERYADAEVKAETNGSDVAIDRLLNGEIDLAAVGRPLTQAEQDAGLSAVAIAREKIAIIVGPDNPFNGDITFQQFGQIFRGEITDWSELGGEPGPIRFVDRPEFSDTRQAFRQYPVFQKAAFVTGFTADPVFDDETDAVIDALGSDGIGYAIANQVMNNGSVSIISMHQTLPDNPAYPFSQPRNYVYLNEPGDTVQGFLGVATGAAGQTAVAEARDAEAAAAVEIEGERPTATSPEGDLTALTNEDNVALIENEAGEVVAGPLLGAGGAVTALAFSEDGQTLATGTSTGNVRFWDADGAPQNKAFAAGNGKTITGLNFDGNDKLVVNTGGQRGNWGLNGLPYGETEAAGAIANATDAGSAATGGALLPWLWLIPLLGLLGVGLWALLGKKKSGRQAEPIRQTAPTATVPPPPTDPETEREVSNRAQSVISTDRVTDESRVVVPGETDTPVSATPETPPFPVGLTNTNTDTAVSTATGSTDTNPASLPLHESTDLESPDLEGTNLDLLTSTGALGGAAAAAGGAAIGGMMLSGLDAGVETDDDDDEEWDDGLDLTLEDTPLEESLRNEAAQNEAAQNRNTQDETTQDRDAQNEAAQPVVSPDETPTNILEAEGTDTAIASDELATTSQPMTAKSITDELITDELITDESAATGSTTTSPNEIELSSPEPVVADAELSETESTSTASTEAESAGTAFAETEYIGTESDPAITKLISPSELTATELATPNPVTGELFAGGLAAGSLAAGGLVASGLAANERLTADSSDSSNPEVETTPNRSEPTTANSAVTSVITDLDNLEPTRGTVIAETETILDIEPTRETIIGDSAVIFGEAASTQEMTGEGTSEASDDNDSSTFLEPDSNESDATGVTTTSEATTNEATTNEAIDEITASDTTEVIRASIPSVAVAAVGSNMADVSGDRTSTDSTSPEDSTPVTRQSSDTTNELAPTDLSTTPPVDTDDADAPDANSAGASTAEAATAGAVPAGIVPAGVAAAGIAAGTATTVAAATTSEASSPVAGTEATPSASTAQNNPSITNTTNTEMEEVSPLSIEELATVDDNLPELPEGYGESRIVLLPRDPKWAYAYWDISNEHKEELRQQGGQRLMLRLYDVTDVDQSVQTPHSMQQQDCHEMARSWYLEVPVSDRDYSAELGYLTADDRWLLLARSAPIRVPPIYPSDWVKDQFVKIDFNESLASRTFGDLGEPYSPEKASDSEAEDLPKIYDNLFTITQGQEALRVAGSLYGSMQHTAPGALSPSGNVSGQPGAAVTGPGFSFNASGLNMSGLNMSGIGSGGSALPVRSRNFWLVADAELIVHGATEPNATLTVGDRVVPLNPDGTFRFHVSFPDGQIDYPIRAVAVDGEQTRSIHLHFERETPERNTNTKAEAKDEWF